MHATYTTPRQIAAIHARAVTRSPDKWDDLHPPVAGLPAWQLRELEKWMATGKGTNGKTMAELAAAGNKAMRKQGGGWNTVECTTSQKRGWTEGGKRRQDERDRTLIRFVEILREEGPKTRAQMCATLGRSTSAVDQYSRNLKAQGIVAVFIVEDGGKRVAEYRLNEAAE